MKMLIITNTTQTMMTMNTLIPENDDPEVCTMTSIGVTAMKSVVNIIKRNNEKV